MKRLKIEQPANRLNPPSRRLVAAGLTLVAAVLCLFACPSERTANGKPAATEGQGAASRPAAGKPGKAPSPQSQAPVPVLAADVVQKTVPIQLQAVGTVEAYSTVMVKAQVSGQLTGVHFQEGQDVKQGDLLFTIDPRPYEAALHKEEANLAKSTVEAKNAEVDRKRFADMLDRGAVATEEYDSARTAAEAAAAQALADQAAVEYAQLQLDYCAICSPLDGRTGYVMAHEGNLVKANDSTALVVVNQISPIYVSFAVPERNLAAIKASGNETEKLKVEVTIPGDEARPLLGELTFIDNEVDRNTGTIRLKATVANEDKRLWPGQFVTVSLTLGVQPDALLVPSQAVQTGQAGQYLLVVKPDQTVESRPVTVGPTVGGQTVVETGVAAGEQVVTDGHLRLVPGAKVEIKSGLGPTE